MRIYEDTHTEFKSIYTDDIKKTVVAFANTEGGTIHIGRADDGSVIGVENPDQTQLSLVDSITNAIRPDITMFVSCSIQEVEGKPIVIAQVQKGIAQPYYLASKGLRPAGVYLRQGASTINASEAAILKMIKESDGDKFEQERSLVQNLTFQAAYQEFQQRKILFEEAQQRSLHLITSEGLYTNLALLLSDQCPFTIKAARFSGTDKYSFQDRAEFGGSLFTQLDKAYAYLEKHNQLSSRFSGLHRIDRQDYPADALREALLNAAIHRDYSYRSSILISIFDDRIEIVSIGGLLPGITPKDILLGISLQRNENLANIFYRLQLVEAFGTGIPRIHCAYKDSVCKPEIFVSENAFKIVLPNQNYTKNFKEPNHTVVQEPNPEYGSPSPSDIYKEKIQAFLLQQSSITRSQTEQLLGVSQATAARILAKMTKDGVLQRLGQGRDTRYCLHSVYGFCPQ